MAPHSDPTGSGPAERTPGAALSETQIERYSRQIILKQVGGRGQAALLSATVAICGSNALATTAGLYLAAAGVGHLRLSAPAVAAIAGVNPDCQVTTLASDAATEVMRGAAVVLCAGARGATCAIHDSCVEARVPVILGDATDTVGWMSVGVPGAPCSGCLTRQLQATVDSAAPLGTVTAGFIGTLLATEAVKIILGLQPSTVGRRVTFAALAGEVRDEPVMRTPQCPVCGSRA
jgi:molybdopterin/thiamine biosynthesis adenylyltransferase